MPKTAELITAPDLETQAQLQRVSRMKIVETKEGYELHVPLRSWLPTGKLLKPVWMALRTRREKFPRKFKNMGTIFAYIEEKFPMVQNVEVLIIPEKIAPKPEPGQRLYAGKASGKAARKPASKAVAKTTKTVKKPPAKATKVR
ncbi:hypothetical protein [Xanthomonas axonopodis]|uniref:hypothetical protein n=1 Tax=Xanthomonas axonopodis TaxID=53413 RepID=UPI003556A174